MSDSVGWRLATLAEEAERNILAPLRQHGWTDREIREVEADEYVGSRAVPQILAARLPALKNATRAWLAA